MLEPTATPILSVSLSLTDTVTTSVSDCHVNKCIESKPTRDRSNVLGGIADDGEEDDADKLFADVAAGGEPIDRVDEELGRDRDEDGNDGEQDERLDEARLRDLLLLLHFRLLRVRRALNVVTAVGRRPVPIPHGMAVAEGDHVLQVALTGMVVCAALRDVVVLVHVRVRDELERKVCAVDCRAVNVRPWVVDRASITH
jgi:hypothetical protein